MAAAITDIPGIGPVTAASLAEHGYRKLRKLANTTIEKLASVPGFSQARATRVIAAARELLPAETGDKDRKAGKGKPKDKEKKGKRGKKDKKDKKGKKAKKDKKGKKDRKRGK